VGKIDDLVDTGDDRFTLRLKGIARFEIASELSTTTPYRQIHANWARFNDQVAEGPAENAIDRRTLLAALSSYLDTKGLDADFDAIAEAPNDVLVNTLAMIIPLGAPEKQALLEAVSVFERAATLETLLKMSVIENSPKEPPKLH
jgi:Lon protease-like protein